MKEGIEIVYVEDVREVLREAFGTEPQILNRLDRLREFGIEMRLFPTWSPL